MGPSLRARLHIHNLKLKSAKCKFFSSEVTYLGHVVTEDGIKTDPEKLKVLCDWPVTLLYKFCKEIFRVFCLPLKWSLGREL